MVVNLIPRIEQREAERAIQAAEKLIAGDKVLAHLNWLAEMRAAQKHLDEFYRGDKK